MATNLPFCFFIQFLEQLLKFLVNFTLLKYVTSQRSYGFLITKKLIFGFQILDLKVHFSAFLIGKLTTHLMNDANSLSRFIAVLFTYIAYDTKTFIFLYERTFKSRKIAVNRFLISHLVRELQSFKKLLTA